MQSIHDQQQNINSSSRSLQTKVKMANCIFGYQVKKTKLSNFSHVYSWYFCKISFSRDLGTE